MSFPVYCHMTEVQVTLCFMCYEGSALGLAHVNCELALW